jgi:hypothetical protein
VLAALRKRLLEHSGSAFPEGIEDHLAHGDTLGPCACEDTSNGNGNGNR